MDYPFFNLPFKHDQNLPPSYSDTMEISWWTTTLVMSSDGSKTVLSFLCIALFRAAGKDAKLSTSTSAPTAQHSRPRTGHGSHSRSHSDSHSRSSSPPYHHALEGRRERRSSPSCSPQSSRYKHRSVTHKFSYEE